MQDVTTTSGLGSVKFALLGGVFGLSGVTALVYQVAWQRILALHSGVGIYSVSMIVAAFLAGLGIGSYAGGKLSTRVSPAASLRIFAGIEIGIGLFALISPLIYYDLLYMRFPGLYASVGSAAVVHLISLIVPTTLMGMSLPFLVHAAVRETRGAFRDISYLYGINVVGAGIGALLAPWLLIRTLGIDGAVRLSAAGNILVGLTALWIWHGLTARAPETGQRVVSNASIKDDAIRAPRSGPRFGIWLALYTLSGMIALSLEIVWFRVIDVGIKSTAFTFGSVLGVFLIGLASGSLVGAVVGHRVRRPLDGFLACQSGLLIYTGAAFGFLVIAPPDLPGFRWFVDYWARSSGIEFSQGWDPLSIVLCYVVFPIFLYGPPTFLMGISFTMLQRAVHDDRQTTGHKVGILQAGNIVGNVTGSLLVGLLLLGSIGTMGTLRAVLAVGAVFPVLGIWLSRPRKRFAVATVLLVTIVMLLPRGERFWMRLHGLSQGPAVIAEDATGVVAVAPEPGIEDEWRMSVNGEQHSWFPFGGIHSRLGAIGAIVHPDPSEIVIIGLGSGDTAWAAGARAETQRVVVYELCSAQRGVLDRLKSENLTPQLPGFLADGRYRILTADGRNALAASDRRFDIIESDALRPYSASSGNLYSREFFRLCAERLRPGGMICQWGATPRVRTTFAEAMPYVLRIRNGEILIGSNDPIDVDLPAWRNRLYSGEVLDYLGPELVDELWADLQTASAEPLPAGLIKPNRDLFPRDELRVPLW